MKKAYGGHVLSDWLGGWRGEVHGTQLDGKESESTDCSAVPSAHRNSPSRIILSNRLKGTLTELPAACVPGGKLPRSSLREDILP